MIPRLDLMLEEEHRYQGPVSGPFILRAGVVTAIVALAMVAVSFAYRAYALNRDLRAARTNWEGMKPRYAQAMESKSALMTLSGYAEEIAGWKRTRMRVAAMMDAIQRAVPTNIQVLRIEYHDDLETPPRPLAGVAPAGPDLQRTARIRISVRAHEPEARSAIERLVGQFQQLKVEGMTNALFMSAELQSVQSPRDDKQGPADTETLPRMFEFEIDCRGQPRALK